MTTQVIIRADDITGHSLIKLANWFENHHPTVPCSIFAMATDTRWDRNGWNRARDLIMRREWEFGAHPRNQFKLSLLPEGELRETVNQSITNIESGLANSGLNYPVTSFAYPCGDYDERTIEILKEFGIKCGLTFPSGFPYESSADIPVGEDRYRWGITHDGQFGLDVWNSRFDRVHAQDGVYILCLHPADWDKSISPLIKNYILGGDSLSGIVKDIGRRSLRSYQAYKWSVLDKHINYIKGNQNAKFTTYKKLLNY